MSNLKDLIATWRTHNQINLYLLGHLPEGGLDATAATDNMPVSRHFAHINDVRMRWAHGAAPDLAKPLAWFEKQPKRAIDAASLQQAIESSSALIEALLRRCAQAKTGVKGFPGSLTAFVAYLVSHESYHWSEISMTLSQCGLPLSREAAWSLWRGWWDADFQARQIAKAQSLAEPTAKASRLKRPRYEMPADIRAALQTRKLLGAYGRRPDYQQNDYVGWITRAKRADTRAKRLKQMLDELAGGTKYMNMPHRES